jgi:beta-galactosidase
VRLYVTDPLHISLPLYSFLKTAGPYVYASDISDKSANVTVEIPVENDRAEDAQVQVSVDVLDRDSKSVLTVSKEGNVQSGGPSEFKVSGMINDPHLWEPGYPYLYRVVCTLKTDNQIVDTCEIPLGVRSVKWDVSSGFFINGHHLKLHGWGQKPTDEWPGLGAAQPNWLHFYTLNLMAEAGGNFVRWGHCAAGPAQIAADDRLGLITEQPGLDGEADTVKAAWKIRAAGWRDMVIYFRNNPSILIWEGGNQKVTHDHAAELRGYVDKYDPGGGRAYAHRRADKTTAEFMTVGIGTEGKREIKTLPVVEGEYDREESPRRVWDDASPPNFGYPEAKGMTYQLTSEQFAQHEVRHFIRKIASPDHAGGANWIFSDSTSGGRVPAEVARTSGEVDGVRLPKEAYYVCGVLFGSEPKVHIIGHWTYPAGTKKTVYVVANVPDVELLINGKSLGHRKPTDGYLFTYPDVAWEPGEIKAIASTEDGKVAATQSKHTVGSAVALKITPIVGPDGLRADGSDVALFDVEAVDAKGERCPTFQKRVDFETDGPGIWRGGYNSGKPKSTNNTYVDLECGINRVAVRSTLTPGSITVRATCDGLTAASATVQAQSFEAENGYSRTLPAMPTPELAQQHGAEMAVAIPKNITSAPQEGTYIGGFFYSGPTDTVGVAKDAAAGKKVFIDGDAKFEALAPELAGADWVSGALADKLYSAVDLMEITVKPGTATYVAIDESLAEPDWIKKQKLKPASEPGLAKGLTIGGRKMKVYSLKSPKEQNLTLGSNSEDLKQTACNMYIVFVNKATGPMPADAGGGGGGGGD